jgi:hypothetical protein
VGDVLARQLGPKMIVLLLFFMDNILIKNPIRLSKLSLSDCFAVDSRVSILYE